jgi:CMP-2-keto-3-deoxyoctulosonic acid synthetase
MLKITIRMMTMIKRMRVMRRRSMTRRVGRATEMKEMRSMISTKRRYVMMTRTRMYKGEEKRAKCWIIARRTVMCRKIKRSR